MTVYIFWRHGLQRHGLRAAHYMFIVPINSVLSPSIEDAVNKPDCITRSDISFLGHNPICDSMQQRYLWRAVVKDTLGGATIRCAVESDAEEISLMSRELFDYLRGLAEEPEAFEQAPFPPQTILRHGFGKRPWFHGLIAEHDGKAVGYLLYHFGYWVEDALPSLHVADLFVREAARGRKIGFALMAEAARIIRQHGGKRVLWTVWSRNRAAVDFYRSLRARFTDDEPLMTWTSESWPE